VVIGEYERAFCGSQFASMAPLFEHYGIQLWTPEVGGRVDFGAEDHEQTMMALGLRPSGRSPAPGSGSAPRWPRRPGNRAGTSAVGRPTGTDWLTRGHTRTGRTRRGGGGRAGWSPTRRRRRRWRGSSRSASPGTVWPGSPARSTTLRFRADDDRVPGVDRGDGLPLTTHRADSRSATRRIRSKSVADGVTLPEV
jgi:hypothetical protein